MFASVARYRKTYHTYELEIIKQVEASMSDHMEMFNVMEKLYTRIPLFFTPTPKFLPAPATPVRIRVMSEEECKNASGVDCVDGLMQIGPRAALPSGCGQSNSFRHGFLLPQPAHIIYRTLGSSVVSFGQA